MFSSSVGEGIVWDGLSQSSWRDGTNNASERYVERLSSFLGSLGGAS